MKLPWMALISVCAFAHSNSATLVVNLQSPADTQFFERSEEGFRRQFGQILEMYRGGHAEEGKARIQEFCLTAPEQWFADHFAPEIAPHLVERYSAMCSDFIAYWDKGMRDLAADRTKEVVVHQAEVPPWVAQKVAARFKPSDIVAVKEPDFSYFSFDVRTVGRSAFSFAELYVYEEGAFRVIGGGGYAFWHYQEDACPKFGRWFGSISQAVVISQTPPQYPKHAAAEHIEGAVRLRVLVAKDGSVTDVTFESGQEELRDAAIEAVRKWKFKPAMSADGPIESDVIVDVKFQLAPH